MAKVVGADGGRKGHWVSIQLEVSSTISFVGAGIFPTLAELLEWGQDAEVVGLDIPIGLPKVPERGGRAAEQAARALLGPRASAVFSTPCRAAVERAKSLGFSNASYAEVSQTNASASSQKLKISKQAFFLIPRIAEVDDHLICTPTDRVRVIETHPELAFSRLSSEPLPPKKTFRGKLARAQLLEKVSFPLCREILAMEDHAQASPDDVLDACACALTASRKLRGEAWALPEDGSLDEQGIPMTIWY